MTLLSIVLAVYRRESGVSPNVTYCVDSIGIKRQVDSNCSINSHSVEGRAARRQRSAAGDDIGVGLVC
jgi:hypothetical protein